MFRVWQSVKCTAEGSARAGTAGVVHAVNPADETQVAVRWDSDLIVELVPVGDLQGLD